MQQKWLRLDLCPRTLNNNNNKMTSNELYIFFLKPKGEGQQRAATSKYIY